MCVATTMSLFHKKFSITFCLAKKQQIVLTNFRSLFLFDNPENILPGVKTRLIAQKRAKKCTEYLHNTKHKNN